MKMGETSMPVRLPELPELLRDMLLEEAVEAAIDEGRDVEAIRFYGEPLPDTPGETLEFSGCYFEKCEFRPTAAGRLVFVDCEFEKCDLDSMAFHKAA